MLSIVIYQAALCRVGLRSVQPPVPHVNREPSAWLGKTRLSNSAGGPYTPAATWRKHVKLLPQGIFLSGLDSV